MSRAGPAHEAGALEALLERLEHMLAHSANMASEEWMLVATLLVEGAEAIGWSEQRERDARGERFDRVLAGWRDFTHGFTSPAFVRATRAARRQNPALFG